MKHNILTSIIPWFTFLTSTRPISFTFAPVPSTACFSTRTRPTLSSSFRLAQAILVPNLFPCQTFSHTNTPTISSRLFFLLTLPLKMEQTERSKTLAYKIQTPGNHPEESIQHSEHGKSLKSRLTFVTDLQFCPNNCAC